MTQGSIRVGIGGWTFEPWRGGAFYPEGLPQKRELEYAASKLTCIEINATYYGRQKPQSFANWAASTPDGFRFSLKASRFATVRKVLAKGADSVAKFLDQGFTELGDKLGPILWQFRDGKRFERDDFARFLDLIPDTQGGLPLRHALEVRDESFRDAAFLDLCRARNMAVVFADSAEFPRIEEQTADFTYARLQQSAAEHAAGYNQAAIADWAEQARTWSRGGRDVYVLFISGAKERNPVAAQAMIASL
ncbi:DUF72 domain-containing protein [Novosphingobium sp. KCTC 2891]|uniref:DUF72 domain-containing protein n=1 Tax=Novosphingobium sp. KCTC 2891 TaxID=2989730 RepID=UPI002223AF9D|nr:DUF72 domain-containing protein [Novosphingobium sp. KCTC 2891]MCW1381775.1 DUF72 domain-containing protein [Novosphingobium sp. KCTC 2891]